MVKMQKLNLETQTTPPQDYEPRTGKRMQGGWTTEKSADGLVRRILHAMHTNDEFVVVLGGDGAAAGHGNHFRQSYLMEFHRIVAPVMARMGVKLITRNLAMGHGMGTLQSTLGFSSLYGKDIDVLIWDCGMTESSNLELVDLFFRQGLMSSGKQGKIPHIFVGGNSNGDGLFQLLRWFHIEADVGVAQLGKATYSVPLTESLEQAQTLPKVLQFVNCTDGAHEICIANAHCTRCWVNRTDIPDVNKLFPNLESYTDSKEMTKRWWYPGWRQHALLGRNLAYAIIDSMQDAVQQWSSGTMGGPPLDDEDWFVTEYYENIKNKLETLLVKKDDENSMRCYDYAKEFSLPSKICNTPMQGATQHTPRPYPNETSIAKLVATDDERLIPVNPKSVSYQGQDVHNDCFDLHDVDVPRIVSQRRRNLKESSATSRYLDGPYKEDDEINLLMPPRFRAIHEARKLHEAKYLEHKKKQSHLQSSRSLESLQMGHGWLIHGEKPGQCDGEYLSICGRESTDSCPLLGYHDSRGELVANEASGWLLLNLPNVKEGIVIVKVFFYKSLETSRNRGLKNWVETGGDYRKLNSVLPFDDDFAFEFAINGGGITSWKKDQVAKQLKLIHKRVETMTLVDDASIVGEDKTVQLAMRVKGCREQHCIFGISHIYWA